MTGRKPKEGGRGEQQKAFSYVPGPLDRWMLGQELLIDLQPESRLLERPDVAVLVDLSRIVHQIVAEAVRFRDVAFEIAAVVDRRQEVDAGGVVEAGHRAVRMHRQLPR